MIGDQIVSLESAANRRAESRFAAAYRRFLENIHDPNTDPEAKRTIEVLFKLTPDEEREIAVCIIDVKTTLISSPVRTNFFIGEERGGMIVATERDRSDDEDFSAELEPMPEGIKFENYMVALADVGSGAAVEFFQYRLDQVLRNIKDPMFKPKATRTITLKIVGWTDSDREIAHFQIDCPIKLAPLIPYEWNHRIGPPQNILPFTSAFARDSDRN